MTEGLIAKQVFADWGKKAFCSVFRVFARQRSLGDWSGEDTPGPMPNPAVKLSSADGTSLVTGRESRSSPSDLWHVMVLVQEHNTATFELLKSTLFAFFYPRQARELSSSVAPSGCTLPRFLSVVARMVRLSC